MDNDGDFVIAWASYGQDGSGSGIFAQRYSPPPPPVPEGSEFQVNTYTTNAQLAPAVAMDGQGGFVITWTSDDQDGSGNGVYAQRYDAAGVAQGSEFQVNTYTTGSQAFPCVAMDLDGDFVICWISSNQDGSNSGIYAQRYNTARVVDGPEFQVNTFTTNYQSTPVIDMDSEGDFVIVWQSYGQDGYGNGVYAQRYNASGAADGPEFQVNTYTNSNQPLPSIGMDSQGNFVIAWVSSGQDGSGSGIYAQRFDATGLPQGLEFIVNTYTTGNQSNTSVAMDSDGDFIIVWQSYGQDGFVDGIYGQRYDEEGVPQGSEFQVNTVATDFQNQPATAMDGVGDFVITWHSISQDGDGFGIYAQSYSAAGTTRGSEFQVNTYTTDFQTFPSIDLDDDGDFVITWVSNDQDGDGFGVYGQRYQSPNPNFPPVSVVNSGLTLDEGDYQNITSAQLAFPDPDNPNSEITYVITGLPQKGMLSRNGNDLALDDSFTQEDINNNFISYIHDDSETTEDTFNFEVNDGANFLAEETFDLTINPLSDPPVLETNSSFSVDEGDSFTVSDDQLEATDIDNDASEIIYQLTGLSSNGTINKGSAALGLNDIFSQEDIDNQDISYTHDGSETTTDSFDFEVGDGTNTLNEASLEITVNPQNDAPELANNQGLTLDRGAEAFISKQELKATDEDNSSGELSFEVVQLPANGSLNKDGQAMSLNDLFTQKDINQGLISYQHENSETTEDSFQFKPGDGTATLNKATFDLTINPVDDPGNGEQPTGLIEQLSRSIQLYPNPVVDKLLLDITYMVGQDIHLVVINSQGITVSERSYTAIGSGLIEIDFSRFTPGLYILRLSDGKKIFWGKVQKL